MADIKLIQTLRQETGASVADIKDALEEAGDNIERARELLKQRGAAIAAKKSEREAHEGRIEAYIHSNGKIGVLLKLYCETDFVARTPDFQELAHDLAMHIAAMAPRYISPQDIPDEVKETEKRIYTEQFADSGKPEEVVEKIIEGKMEKFAADVSLLKQPFVKDQDKTVEAVVREYIAKLGENIQVGDFTRYEL